MMPLKVLHITDTDLATNGGIQAVVRSTSLISKKKYKIKIICSDNNKSVAYKQIKIAVKLIREIIQKNKYNSVVVHDPHVFIISFLSLFLNTENKVIMSHGWIFHKSSALHRRAYFKFVKLFILKRFTKIACVSKNDFVKVKNLKNAIITGNPVENLSDVIIQRTQKLRVGCCLSRMDDHKNIERNISILEDLIISKNIDSYIIAGQGVSELKHLIGESGFILESPTSEQVNGLFTKSSIFVCSSSYEGFGLTALQALSYGCQCILADNEAYVEHSKKFHNISLIGSQKTIENLKVNEFSFEKYEQTFKDLKKHSPKEFWNQDVWK